MQIRVNVVAVQQAQHAGATPINRRATVARGFTYLGLMFLIAVLAMTAAMASVVWTQVRQRDNELELIYVGLQFQSAIENYARRGKGTEAAYPRKLEDLLADTRDLQIVRYLRKLYLDPMTASPSWGLIRLPDGGIVGLHSLSRQRPIRQGELAEGLAFPLARNYQQWRFIAPSAVERLAQTMPAQADANPTVPNDRARKGSNSGDSPLGGEPPNPDVEAPPPINVPRPSQQDYRNRTPEACSRIAAHDQQQCNQQQLRHGAEAGRECQESALARTLACPLSSGEPLPALVLSGP